MNTLRLVSQRGDDPLARWTPGNAKAVAAAQAIFDSYVKGPYVAFTGSAGQGEILRAFDPDAKETILFPAPVAG